MRGRFVTQHPDVPAYAEWSARSQVWTLTLQCPYCGDPHMHGGGSGPEPDYGYRVAHCLAGGPPDYRLIPGPPGMPKPAARRMARLPRRPA